MHDRDLMIFDSDESLSSFASELIMTRLSDASTLSHPFSFVLSGGSTPRRIYDMIAHRAQERCFSWDNIHLFWGDERCVPPDDPRSNFKMANESLLSKIDIENSSIHRIKGEVPPEKGAALYEQELVSFAGAKKALSFDLLLLGLGEDGHTASLFPSSPALQDDEHLVTYTVKDGLHRVTITFRAINQAKEVLFIVTGSNKATAVAGTLMGGHPAGKHPAQYVCPLSGKVLWLLDAEAASLLS